MSYTVTAFPEGPYWALLIDADDRPREDRYGNLGATQSHSREDAEYMVRDYLSITDHADAGTAQITWIWQDGPVPQNDE